MSIKYIEFMNTSLNKRHFIVFCLVSGVFFTGQYIFFKENCHGVTYSYNKGPYIFSSCVQHANMLKKKKL